MLVVISRKLYIYVKKLNIIARGNIICTFTYSFICYYKDYISHRFLSSYHKINPENIVPTFHGHRINVDETRFGETLRTIGGKAAPKGDHRQKAEKGVSDDEEQPRGGRRGRKGS